MLKKPKPKFNAEPALNTKPKTKEKEFMQETVDNQISPDTLDIHIIRTTPLI